MCNVLIIGTGKIGTRLTEQLVIDKFVNTIYLSNRTPTKLFGTFKSLNIWSHLMQSNSSIKKFDINCNNKITNEIDLLVIALKENYDPRYILKEDIPKYLPSSLRFVGIGKDLPLVYDVCRKLHNFKGIVLVLTNPVDIITYFVSKWMPSAQVFGSGLSLDSARISFLISKLYRKFVPYNELVLCGTHGDKIKLIKSLINYDVLKLDETIESTLIKESNQTSIDIVNYLGYTLQDCAYVFSRDIRWLLKKDNYSKFSSFSIKVQDTCIGVPVHYDRNSNYTLQYNNFSSDENSFLEDQKEKNGSMIKHIENNIEL